MLSFLYSPFSLSPAPVIILLTKPSVVAENSAVTADNSLVLSSAASSPATVLADRALMTESSITSASSRLDALFM